ncbi:MAG TPA: hypothetical protein VMW54_08870 [Terriglobia bacterium]|nr:hypothetical protein [Terriglobia bacterium]
MQEYERHVLTIEDPILILNVLSAFSASVETESGATSGICERLKAFSKQGCDALILNLRVMKEPVVGTPSTISIVGASLVGAVLVVTCRVTASWIVQVQELCRRDLFPKDLVSKLGGFVQAFF